MPRRKSRTMSRAQRRAAFLESAARMYNQLEEWYDEHPDATFGEIEAQARQYRLKLMGETMALMINGRTEGYELEAPSTTTVLWRMRANFAQKARAG